MEILHNAVNTVLPPTKIQQKKKIIINRTRCHSLDEPIKAHTRHHSRMNAKTATRRFDRRNKRNGAEDGIKRARAIYSVPRRDVMRRDERHRGSMDAAGCFVYIEGNNNFKRARAATFAIKNRETAALGDNATSGGRLSLCVRVKRVSRCCLR